MLWPSWYDPPGRRAFNPIRRIMQAAREHYGVDPDDLMSRSRSKATARARQMAMYIAWKHTNATYPQIGAAFGRDSSTCVYNVQVVKARISADPEWAGDYRDIRAMARV